MLELLYYANLNGNLEKSKFFETEVDFLSYIISKLGIVPNKAPKKLKELKKFLSLAFVYREFKMYP